MSDPDDEVRNYALCVVLGVVALVIVGVVALATATMMRSRDVSAPGAVTHNAAAASAYPFGPPETLYFEPGSDRLSFAAQEVLARVSDAARAHAGAVVRIAGFHDEAGSAKDNADLAYRRAVAVRHALEANGVLPSRLVVVEPGAAVSAGPSTGAGRVELRME